MKSKLTCLLVAIVVLALSPAAMAVPYASGISQSGSVVSFILNQNAYTVEAILGGGAQTLSLGTTAGQLSFDLGAYSTYQIRVVGNTAPGWTQYIPDGGASDRNFYTPTGVSIDKNPASPNFGKVFVSNATSATTAAGRNTPEGIYALRADGVAAGFGTGGVTWGGTSGPFKSTIGPDGHLYVVDLSNDLAYEMSSDLQSATQLIQANNRTSLQWVHSIYVTGTQAGGDRKIYLVNGNFNDTARKGVIEYNLGGNATATAGDTGTQMLTAAPFNNYYPYDIARDSNGDWYVNSYRSATGQAAPIVKFDGTGTYLLDDDIIWSASSAYAGSPVGIDINETAGTVAYVAYDNGVVRIFDMETGAFLESFTPGSGSRGRELAYDAAGNLVIVNSSSEYARYFSPGGYTEATTTWDGSQWTFGVIPEPGSISLLVLGGLALLLRRRG